MRRQLADELAARDRRRADLGYGIDAGERGRVIAQTCDAIFSGSVIVRRTAAEAALRALHPVEAPAGFWATPLGRMTAAARAADTPAEAWLRNKQVAAMLRITPGRVTHLVEENKLEAYPDVPGAVRTRSVYARLARWAGGDNDAWDSRYGLPPELPAVDMRGRDPYTDAELLIEIKPPPEVEIPPISTIGTKRPPAKSSKRRRAEYRIGTGPAKPVGSGDDLMGYDD